MEPDAETVTAGKKEKKEKEKHENVHRNLSNHSSDMGGISGTAQQYEIFLFFQRYFFVSVLKLGGALNFL